MGRAFMVTTHAPFARIISSSWRPVYQKYEFSDLVLTSVLEYDTYVLADTPSWWGRPKGGSQSESRRLPLTPARGWEAGARAQRSPRPAPGGADSNGRGTRMTIRKAAAYVPDAATRKRNPYSVGCPACEAPAYILSGPSAYCRGRESYVGGVGYVVHSERWLALSQTPA